MGQQDHITIEEYEQNAAHLAQFLEDRERFRATIKAAEMRGVKVSAAVKAETEAKLREFDEIIDDLEGMLAEEYERIEAEKAKEAQITELVKEGWESSKRIYLIIKHTTPHLLDSFAEACLTPLTPGQREKFLDEVAILEATKLDAILKGED